MSPRDFSKLRRRRFWEGHDFGRAVRPHPTLALAAEGSSLWLQRRVCACLNLLAMLLVFNLMSTAQTSTARIFSGTVITDKNELLPNATLTVESRSGKKQSITDANGRFKLLVAREPITVNVTG